MKNNTRILVICAMAVVLNVVLGEAVTMMKIPLLFLDTMGTIFAAANYGMGYGILTGVCSNLLMGAISGPLEIPFALVSVAVAITVALIAKHRFGYKQALIAGLLLSFVSPLIGTPIRLALYGGFTGSGTDIVIIALRASGEQMITATFWGAVAGNVVDKILSCFAVSWMMKRPSMKNVVKEAH